MGLGEMHEKLYFLKSEKQTWSDCILVQMMKETKDLGQHLKPSLLHRRREFFDFCPPVSCKAVPIYWSQEQKKFRNQSSGLFQACFKNLRGVINSILTCSELLLL